MAHPWRAGGRARRERRKSSEQRLRIRTRGLTRVPWCDPPGRYSATTHVAALAARLTFVAPSGSISPRHEPDRPALSGKKGRERHGNAADGAGRVRREDGPGEWRGSL